MVLGSEKYAEMGSNEVQIHFTVLKYIFLVSILYCTMNVSDITFTHFYTNICTFYFYTLTWVKKSSQYFNFYQSIFKHEYLFVYLSEGCVYFCHLCKYDSWTEVIFSWYD